jgi:hypothetical protein
MFWEICRTFCMFWPENNVGTWQHWALSTNQDEVLHWGLKGEWTNDEVTNEFSESYFTLVKHKRHRKGVSVQKPEDHKTLILILLGEITFVIGPDSFFVNLWGACDSSVLQCMRPEPAQKGWEADNAAINSAFPTGTKRVNYLTAILNSRELTLQTVPPVPHIPGPVPFKNVCTFGYMYILYNERKPTRFFVLLM